MLPANHSCQLPVSVEDLKRLFWDDPQKMWVGKKGDMVVELVKMLYFEYTLEIEVNMEVALYYMDDVMCHEMMAAYRQYG